MRDYQAILNHVPALLLVIFRIGGLMVFSPVLGSSIIPVRIKILLTFVIGLAVYAALGAASVTHAPLSLDLLTLAPLIAMEVLVGIVLGYCASLPLFGLQTGGVIMGQQMGLSFAHLINPATEEETDPIGQLLFFMALGVFIIVGGLEWMLGSILESFRHVPLGGMRADLSLVDLVCGLLDASFELALRVAAPLLAIVALETIALGFLARTVPQLNVLNLGFPLRILLGLAVLSLAVSVMQDVLLDHLHRFTGAMGTWLEGAGHMTTAGDSIDATPITGVIHG